MMSVSAWAMIPGRRRRNQTAATTAAALRARTQLVDDLRWHTAAAASFLANMEAFEKKTSRLKQQIDSLE